MWTTSLNKEVTLLHSPLIHALSSESILEFKRNNQNLVSFLFAQNICISARDITL